jgi:hypothetical protein
MMEKLNRVTLHWRNKRFAGKKTVERERERVVVLSSVVYRKERDGKERGEYDEKLSLMSQREGKL